MNLPLPDKIVNAIQSVVGEGPVGLHEPTFTGNEWLYVKECIDTTFVSSVGKFVDRFEDDLASYTGAKHAVAVVNGTAALHIALVLAGVQTNDEVLVPSHTAQHSGQCINIATGQVIRAMVPMHTFGHPVDIDGLLAVAHDFNIVLVEDAAESLGSLYHGHHTGTFGLMGTLSFNGNKTITTGGGGAILTNDSAIARRAKHITTTARLPHAWELIHDEIGYNFRLPNLNAALGCAQLEQLPDKLISKRKLFNRYQTAFAAIKEAKLIAEPAQCESNYWLQTIMLNTDQVCHRGTILHATNKAELMTRPVWRLIHQLTPFANCPRMDLSMAEQLAQQLINIPSSSHLLRKVK